MIVTCYFCNKSLPSSQMKRCSQCLLVTYCSRECQSLSWKASHKHSCKPHPSVDPSKPSKPEKFSPEWAELEVDRQLSRWLEIWRYSFQKWATMALDLANHPPERLMTHCMHLVVEPVDLEDDPAKQYRIIDASLSTISSIRSAHPALELTIDPTDFTRLRFVLLLQNFKGEPRRLRLVQWNDLNAEGWRAMGKESSRKMAEGWEAILMWSVLNMKPAEVERQLWKKRS